MKKIKLALLPRIIIAMLLGVLVSLVAPNWLAALFVTVNGVFGNFLDFTIPLIILGLVAPGISEMGTKAGKLLLVTALIAYGSTLFSGFGTFFSCKWAFVDLLQIGNSGAELETVAIERITPWFTINMPPVIEVMTALILAFVLGLGVTISKGDVIKKAFAEFREVILCLITKVIIPFLPIYIFGIFLKMGVEGEVARVMSMFVKVIVVIFVLGIAA